MWSSGLDAPKFRLYAGVLGTLAHPRSVTCRIASARNSGVYRLLDMDTSSGTLMITRIGVYKSRGSPHPLLPILTFRGYYP